MPNIFKIVDSTVYQRAVLEKVFEGALIDLKDGFIHFSTAEQVTETARLHFAAQNNLTIFAVPAEALGAALKWEASRGGQLFPHLYAKLDMSLVLWAKPLVWHETAHVFPAETFQ